jgi:predicted GIY-YIG superfamily endonuclease
MGRRRLERERAGPAAIEMGEAMTTNLYRHFDAEGALLYVGISLSAVHRLAQHRDHSGWFADIKRVEIVNFETREDALSAETEAIRNENPKWNIQRRPFYPPRPRLEASVGLTRRVVDFKPLYSLSDAGDVLGTSSQGIKALMDARKLSYVEIPRGTTTRRFITGWQLIEYIESLEGKVHDSLPD